MKGIVYLLAIIIALAGLLLVLYSVVVKIPFNYNPYTGMWTYETITVYPYQIVGAIVLLIGFVTFVIGLAIPEEKVSGELKESEEETGQAELTEFTGESVSKEMVCGTCVFFHNPMMCPYKEKNARARYCVYYKSQKTKLQNSSP